MNKLIIIKTYGTVTFAAAHNGIHAVLRSNGFNWEWEWHGVGNDREKAVDNLYDKLWRSMSAETA